ncbi:fasciculation and elongation protein zeta-2 isoform X2 [Hoplias malabaricus]|uniref:fasciculation and elongation protein zeta-2 isoform X2 n=1 Tax=Hoplias malabaricus TaxID=27720 RepID=UPI003461C001
MAAPLAQFDEDWQDFNEFKAAGGGAPEAELEPLAPGLDELSDLELGFSAEICSFQSMEDLVHDFDEKLTVCFRNYNTATENIAPVKPITEEGFLKDDEIWNALTDNYGNVMPVDWKTSHTRSLHLPTLNLTQQPDDNMNLDLSDDEELREQMDLHSIIISCVNEEPLFTAEQVIEEIEEMMQESPDPEAEERPSDLSALSHELHTLSHSTSTSSYEERLRGLGVGGLEEVLEEVEREIRGYSEELIEQLALRDELEFEKEVKNGFISVLIEVQNRQKELRDAMKRRRKIATATQKSERTHTPGTYLTTVIPYEKKSGAPSVEDLQILTKILHAMKEDSEKVPGLLTDYILKVLCPT